MGNLRIDWSYILITLIFLCFVYSGALKWLTFWPIDPTVLFGSLISLMIITRLMIFKNLSLTINTSVVFFVVIFFLTSYFLTAIYTSSYEFYYFKMLSLILLLLSISGPVMILKNSNQLDYLFVAILIFSAGIAVFVIILHYFGILYIYILSASKEIDRFPDYLVLGTIVGTGAVIGISYNTAISNSITVLNFFCLLLLTGRGPFLFALIVCLFIVISRAKILEFTKGMMVLFLLAYLGFTLEFFDTIIARFGDAVKVLPRLNEFKVAIDVISLRPFTGSGLGSYGIEGYRIDGDIYPHNIFLEIWAEGGVLMLILLIAILCLVIFVNLKSIDRNHHVVLSFYVLTYIFLNYLKSGGFIGARDLFFFLGVNISAVSLVCLKR